MRDTIGIWNASGAAIQVVAFMFSRLGRPRKGENRLGLLPHRAAPLSELTKHTPPEQTYRRATLHRPTESEHTMTRERTATDSFADIRELFESKLDGNQELGASIALDIDGQRVFGFWRGYRNPERTNPWTRDTIMNAFSTTKLATALTVLALTDR